MRSTVLVLLGFLLIVCLSSSHACLVSTFLPANFNVTKVQNEGNTAFIANGIENFAIVDITDLRRPVVTSSAVTVVFAIYKLILGSVYTYSATQQWGIVRLNTTRVVTSNTFLDAVSACEYNTSRVTYDMEIRKDETAIFVQEGQDLVVYNTTVWVCGGLTETPKKSLQLLNKIENYYQGIVPMNSIMKISQDNTKLFTAWSGGFRIVDISNPSDISILANVSFNADQPESFTQSQDGNILFLTTGSTGLFIYNITDPSNPVTVNQISNPFGSPSYLNEVHLSLKSPNRAYVGDSHQGVSTLDISNLQDIKIIRTVNTTAFGYSLNKEEDLLFVAAGGVGLEIYDLLDREEYCSAPLPSIDGSKKEDDNKAAIIGGVIGGFVGLLLLIAIVFGGMYLLKRRDRGRTAAFNLEMMADDAWEINYPDLEIGEMIGSGNFGVVYLSKWRGGDCVVKQMKMNVEDKVAVTEFLAEANNMKRLRHHPNVCHLFGVCTNPAYPLCIITEYLPEGSLYEVLHSDMEIDVKKALAMMSDIAGGMGHLHSENILHCDLAARNLLVTKKGNGYQVKVADFGLSRKADSSYAENNNAKFPIKWSAPEVITQHKFSKASDVWSFGVVMWEILERRVPFEGNTNKEVAELVCNADQRLPKPIRIEYPPELFDLMQSCWNKSPESRPSFAIIGKELQVIKDKVAGRESVSLSKQKATDVDFYT